MEVPWYLIAMTWTSKTFPKETKTQGHKVSEISLPKSRHIVQKVEIFYFLTLSIEEQPIALD